jgi:hypothetical protein
VASYQTLAQGVDEDRTRTITITRAGKAVTTYTRGNALWAKVWRGDDTATAIEPIVSWRDPTKGLVYLTIPRAMASQLTPGSYWIAVWIREPGGEEKRIFRARLRMEHGPGSAVAAKSYNTADDMTTMYAPVADLLADTDETDFAEERGQARDDVNQRVEDCVSASEKVAMRAALEADGLLVTKRVRKIATLLSLANILEDQNESDDAAKAAGRDSPHQKVGAKFRERATAELDLLQAEVDLDDDGEHEKVVDCNLAKFVMSTDTSRRLGRGVLRLGTYPSYDPEC